jgi:hypothetical protein
MIARPSIGLLVTEAMERRLRRALPSVPFATLKDWLELAFFDLESPALAFVVDPLLLPAEHRTDTMRQLGKRRRVPVILYAKIIMEPRVAGMLLEMGQLGIRHLMFFNIDDNRAVLREVLASAVLGER